MLLSSVCVCCLFWFKSQMKKKEQSSLSLKTIKMEQIKTKIEMENEVS